MGAEFPDIEYIDGCALLCGSQELNLGPLEELPMFLTVDLSFYTKWNNSYRKQYFEKNLSIELLCDSAILLLIIYLKVENRDLQSYSQLFIKALFTVSKRQKTPNVHAQIYR